MWIKTVFSIYLPNTMFNITSQLCIEKKLLPKNSDKLYLNPHCAKNKCYDECIFLAQYVRCYKGLIFEIVL